MNFFTLFKRRPKGDLKGHRPATTRAQPQKGSSKNSAPFWMFWKKTIATTAKPSPQKQSQQKLSQKPSQKTAKTTRQRASQAHPKQPQERDALIAEALNIHRQGQKIWAEVDPALREGLARMVRGAYGLGGQSDNQRPPLSRHSDNQQVPSEPSQPQEEKPIASSLTPPPARRK